MQLALLLGGFATICTALPQQLGTAKDRAPGESYCWSRSAGKPLKGKFLHITDIHPDPFFKTYSSTDDESACHRGRGPAGFYGAETSGCDSPVSLLNATFKWINETIRDEIDFIIWTGDSARHDNDERIPRSEKQVVSQNDLVVSKFLEVFGKPENYDDPDPTNDFTIPIIPSFGNNDILPHNIFTEGPNRWTKRFLDIWRQFIPEEQRHQFARGGWFYVEAIPNKLAVISLNTLYFFDSNSAVDGCAARSEPGYEHFEWLRIQLQILRERGMKAMLIGHVPPARVDSKMSWDETCWQKYTLWQKQYRDVIVGNFYGHMNIDHFMLQDFKDIKKTYKHGYSEPTVETSEHNADEEFAVQSATDYLVDLRDYFAKIPAVGSNLSKKQEDGNETVSWWDYFTNKKNKDGNNKNPLSKIGGEYGERYSLAFVQASVVPNYFPTLRVFSYNVSGLEHLSSTPGQVFGAETADSAQKVLKEHTDHPSFIEKYANDIATSFDIEEEDLSVSKRNSRKQKRKYKFKVPSAPSKSTPPGPAYSPQSFSLLGYTQYFANLTHINNDFVIANEDVDEQRWKEGKHSGKTKKGKPHPKKFKYEVEYETIGDKVFELKDLTVRSYIDLAKRIASSKKSATVQEEEDVEEERGFLDREAEEEIEQVGAGKKHNKHNKHNKKKAHNKVWFAFIKRAFVGTMDPAEIEERFAASNPVLSKIEEADAGAERSWEL